MLDTRVTPEQWAALTDAEKAHYTKGTDSKGEGYFLQTNETTGLKRSLQTERTEKESAVRMLKKLVPELTDDNRSDWEDLVTTAAEHAAELKAAGVDLDEWKTLKDGKGKDKGAGGKGEDVAEQLLESQKRVRELEREKQALERDKGKVDGKLTKLQADNDKLVKEISIGKALDAAKITDPDDRRVVTALLESQGLVIQDIGSGEQAAREVFVKVDGQQVPIGEHTKDFTATDLGKRFVKAPDSSGATDGPTPAPKPPTPAEFAKLDPLQKLGAALDNSAASAQGKK